MDILRERTYPTPLSNSPLLPLLLLSLLRQRHSPDPSENVKEEYDYIIVGGGAAGSVVASRLSEIPCVSVLLLEAGPKPPLLTEIPSLGRYFLGTDVDWNFKTVPQKHAAFGLKNNQILWASGKMLGGSANHNGLAYVRGNPWNYDKWEALGAKGWSYKDVFPYFLRLEDNRSPYFLKNGYHFVGGPISVEQPRYQSELKEAFLEAAEQLGYPIVDINAEADSGFYDVQRNMRDAQRCSSVKGYLVPAENRTNFDILVNAFATKVVINEGRATGVEFVHEGKNKNIRAKGEVIVSGGTVNTAKLLMLSGIGPKEELQKWNIPVIADLPVGKNFVDHATSLYYFTLDPSMRSYDEKLSDDSNINQYICNRTGPLTAGYTLLEAFLSGLNKTSASAFPDYVILLGEMPMKLFKGFGLKEEVYELFMKPYENHVVAKCKSQHMRPESKGTITLMSSDPFDPPLIDPNYLEDPEDLKPIVDGFKMCRKLLGTDPLQRLGAKPFETVVPGCENFTKTEDEYLECYARTLLFTSYHAVGSAKMGDPLDPTTVVDPELRVKNIEGLRVIDASIMPTIPSSNINIPVIMIAEKASDYIKSNIIFRILDEMQ